jgi:hypothetical protein
MFHEDRPIDQPKTQDNTAQFSAPNFNLCSATGHIALQNHQAFTAFDWD